MLAFWPKFKIERLKGSFSKPQHYTCCGKMHVEAALIVCMIIELFLGVIQFILTHKHKVVFVGIDSSIIKFFDFVEFIALCFLSYAMWNKSPKWMIPYMGLQFYFFIGWSLYCILFIVTYLFPELPVKNLVYRMESNLDEIFRIIAFAYVTIFEAWFLKVSVACYVYYSNKKNGILFSKTFVNSQPNTNHIGPIIEVFYNPNYIDNYRSGSEDDWEYEKPVFTTFPNANSIS